MYHRGCAPGHRRSGPRWGIRRHRTCPRGPGQSTAKRCGVCFAAGSRETQRRRGEGACFADAERRTREAAEAAERAAAVPKPQPPAELPPLPTTTASSLFGIAPEETNNIPAAEPAAPPARTSAPRVPDPELRYAVGDEVSWHSMSDDDLGWVGTVEDTRGDRYRVLITRVSLPGLMAGIREGVCTGNHWLDHRSSQTDTRIWVPRGCVERGD